MTRTGRLEVGVHTYTLAELKPLLGTTPYRRMMWNRFIAFMGWPILTGGFAYAYMGGGYPSESSRPRDIDLVLQTRAPYGPEAFQSIERFFRLGLEKIEWIYGIHLHFWMDNAPPGICDFKNFFQYSRPQDPHKLDRQGLIRISLLDSDITEQYREMLGGFELLDDAPNRPPQQ